MRKFKWLRFDDRLSRDNSVETASRLLKNA
jgi:hypothetical protein